MPWGKIIRIGGSVLLISLLAWKLDWKDLGALIVHCDVRYLLGAVVLTQMLVLTLSVRLHYMVLPYKLVPTFGTVCRVTWVGQFFNSCLPGSTGGDFYKIYEMCRLNPDQRPAAAAAIVADRVFALLALLSLAATGLLAGVLPLRQLASGDMVPSRTLFYAGLALLALIFAGCICLTCSSALRARAAHLWRVGITTLRQTRLYFGNVRRAVIVYLLAVGGFLILFGAVYCIAQSLDIQMTYLHVIAIMPLLMLAVLLPVTINGHGLREVILIGFFTWLKLGSTRADFGPRECAVAFSLLLVANDLVSVIPGCCLYFKRRRKNSMMPNAQTADNQ